VLPEAIAAGMGRAALVEDDRGAFERLTAPARDPDFASDREVPTRAFPWGEIRGEGAYAVLPPSVHQSGLEYEWRVSLDESEFAPCDALLEAGRPLLMMSKNSGTESEVLLTRYAQEREQAVAEQRYGPAALPSKGEALARLDRAVGPAMASMGVNVPPGRKFSCIPSRAWP
jgi:hypothetical protein